MQEGEKRSVIGEGVAAGDTVITSGFANLQDGAKIKIDTGSTNPAPSASAAPVQGVAAKSQDDAANPRKTGAKDGKREHKRRRKGRRRRGLLRAASRRAIGEARSARRQAEPADRGLPQAMSISAPFIARPIATSLLAVAMLLSSLLAYSFLPISSLPQVDFPSFK